MASKRPSGLGKGLGALLGDDVMKTESSGSLFVPISQVESYSGQPRKHFDEESLQELADSITQHGIIQPGGPPGWQACRKCRSSSWRPTTAKPPNWP